MYGRASVCGTYLSRPSRGCILASWRPCIPLFSAPIPHPARSDVAKEYSRTEHNPKKGAELVFLHAIEAHWVVVVRALMARRVILGRQSEHVAERRGLLLKRPPRDFEENIVYLRGDDKAKATPGRSQSDSPKRRYLCNRTRRREWETWVG